MNISSSAANGYWEWCHSNGSQAQSHSKATVTLRLYSLDHPFAVVMCISCLPGWQGAIMPSERRSILCHLLAHARLQAAPCKSHNVDCSAAALQPYQPGHHVPESLRAHLPFKHVPQVDDEAARHSLHIHPRLSLQYLQARRAICQQQRQHAVVCVRPHPKNALLRARAGSGVVERTQECHRGVESASEELPL